MALASSLVLKPGAMLDGRFKIVRELGAGAMAVVVLAEHVGLRCPVAVKLLKAELANNSDLVTRFLREARAVARLTNEHVAHIMDVGTLSSGTPFFVMEYLEGLDLAELLNRRGTLGKDEVVEYVLQALEALAEAHRSGIVHRDLKPANLFLATRSDEFPLIKVLDFGISKLNISAITSGTELTRPSGLLGSPIYMSPEQLKDARSVDARTDIWSLGVTLYELLLGEPPFDGPSVSHVIASICSSPVPSVRDLRPELPRELDLVITRCLSRDRNARFASVEDLARALAPLAGTAACHVSIERILRSRSNPPAPPRNTYPSLIVHDAAPSGSFALEEPTEVDSEETTTLETPRESRRPLPARPLSWGVAGAAAGLVLLGSFYLGRLAREPSAPAVVQTVGASRPAAVPSEVATGIPEAVPLPAPEPEAMPVIAEPSPSLAAPALPARAPKEHQRRSPRTNPAPKARVERENAEVPAPSVETETAAFPAEGSSPVPRSLDTSNPFAKR